MECKVIALIQRKGGVTKTTTAINLLGAFLEAGFKSKLCDMDSPKPDAILWADFGDDLVEHVIPLFDENPRHKLDELKKENQIIILDTPPQLEEAALKAAYLCDLAIIPCSVSDLDKESLVNASKPAIFYGRPYIFLASRTIKNTNSTKDLIEELEKTGASFKANITNSVAMAECISKGTWIGKYVKNGVNHLQYKGLIKEILTLWGWA